MQLPLFGDGRAAEAIGLAVLLPYHAYGNRDRRFWEGDAERWLGQRAGISLREKTQSAVADIQDANERIVDASAQLAARTAPGPSSREREALTILGDRKATLDNSQQLRRLHRFQQEVRPELASLCFQSAIRVTGNDDDRDPLRIHRREVKTVELRQPKIGDDQVRGIG